MGLRLDPGQVLERWSCNAEEAERLAVYEMLFAFVEGRGAAYALQPLDSRRRTVAARVAGGVVVRMRLTDDDRIRLLGIGPVEAP